MVAQPKPRVYRPRVTNFQDWVASHGKGDLSYTVIAKQMYDDSDFGVEVRLTDTPTTWVLVHAERAFPSYRDAWTAGKVVAREHAVRVIRGERVKRVAPILNRPQRPFPAMKGCEMSRVVQTGDDFLYWPEYERADRDEEAREPSLGAPEHVVARGESFERDLDGECDLCGRATRGVWKKDREGVTRLVYPELKGFKWKLQDKMKWEVFACPECVPQVEIDRERAGVDDEDERIDYFVERKAAQQRHLLRVNGTARAVPAIQGHVAEVAREAQRMLDTEELTRVERRDLARELRRMKTRNTPMGKTLVREERLTRRTDLACPCCRAVMSSGTCRCPRESATGLAWRPEPDTGEYRAEVDRWKNDRAGYLKVGSHLPEEDAAYVVPERSML